MNEGPSYQQNLNNALGVYDALLISPKELTKQVRTKSNAAGKSKLSDLAF